MTGDSTGLVLLLACNSMLEMVKEPRAQINSQCVIPHVTWIIHLETRWQAFCLTVKQLLFTQRHSSIRETNESELDVSALKTNYLMDRILCLGRKLILPQCTHFIVLVTGIKRGHICKAFKTMRATW